MAKSLGYITIYNNNGDIVYQHKGSSGDYAVTVSLNNNIITLRSGNDFGADPPQVEPIETDPEFPEYVDPFSTIIDTGEVSVSNTTGPISLRIALPYNASKIRYFGGNSGSFADEVYMEGYEDLVVNQGDSITTAESNYSSGGGCAIQYYEASTPKVSVDLTTLTGWSALSDGEHTVQIVAKGTGYRDSAKSTSVTVTKGGSTGETWVLNEEPHFSPLVNTTEFEVPFSINSVTYSVLRFESELVPMHTDAVNISVSSASIVQTSIYYSGSWVNEAYRTITFERAPTGDLRTWLQANGKKQEI